MHVILIVQIVVPYHFPLEFRTDSIEALLQKMWTDAVRRKLAPPKKPTQVEATSPGVFDDGIEDFTNLDHRETSEDIIIGT